MKAFSLHKISAVLLSLIGCDSSIDQNEVNWFKTYLSQSDQKSIRGYLSSDVSKIIQGLSNEHKMLCYILGLDLAMSDFIFHENEKFWLNELFESLDPTYEMSSDLIYIYFSVVDNNLQSAYNFDTFFLKPLRFLKEEPDHFCKNWKISQYLFSKKSKGLESFSFLFEREFNVDETDQFNFLIEFASSIISHKENKIISKNFNTLSKTLLKNSENSVYSEFLMSELLKISLLDGNIEQLEEDYLRELQFKFMITNDMMRRVVFLTSFLLGKNSQLRPHLNYNQI